MECFASGSDRTGQLCRRGRLFQNRTSSAGQSTVGGVGVGWTGCSCRADRVVAAGDHNDCVSLSLGDGADGDVRLWIQVAPDEDHHLHWCP